MQRAASNCYLFANEFMLSLLKENRGNLRISFSLSGMAVEQFRLYAPEVLSSYKTLADTGLVEFLAEPYSHSLVSLKDEEIFRGQVKAHADLMEELFGTRPQVFNNTELIYFDRIGELISEMGFSTLITEGAEQVLQGRSPNNMYFNRKNPRLNVLLRNSKLSDYITYSFGNYQRSDGPLSVNTFLNRILEPENLDEVVNLFLDYETFGECQDRRGGIFDFLKGLTAKALEHQGIRFSTPSEVVDIILPEASLKAPHPISRSGKGQDVSTLLGNEMQLEAIDKLYALWPIISRCTNSQLLKDWSYLQCCDHFYYMSHSFFIPAEVDPRHNPYKTPYEAFINYMNVLNDFTLRLNANLSEKKCESHGKN
jgi:alpha-amylase